MIFAPLSFQSTLLTRGATHSHTHASRDCAFQSTLLTRGATPMPSNKLPNVIDFNPRSSREERLPPALMFQSFHQFQSTLLTRGATKHRLWVSQVSVISIHAPHARSDEYRQQLQSSQKAFQSTLLTRGATATESGVSYGHAISIHAPHARSDQPCSDCCRFCQHFNPRSSREERRICFFTGD